MQPHHHLLRAVQVPKQLVLLFVFLASAFALAAVGFVSSVAQSPEKEEREIEDISPKHLPIKFKVKNEEKIKDLKNERWERDLEIEVTNTGARPIYFISFSLGMPEAKGPNGQVIGFTFKYGRINLIDYTVKAEPGDIPLLPSATHVFKIREDDLKGWESGKAEYPNPKKLRIRFYSLSFGDGTGLISDGTPVGGRNKVSSNNCSNGSGPPGKSAPAVGSIPALFLPAAFRPVNFYPGYLGGAVGADSRLTPVPREPMLRTSHRQSSINSQRSRSHAAS